MTSIEDDTETETNQIAGRSLHVTATHATEIPVVSDQHESTDRLWFWTCTGRRTTMTATYVINTHSEWRFTQTIMLDFRWVSDLTIFWPIAGRHSPRLRSNWPVFSMLITCDAHPSNVFWEKCKEPDRTRFRAQHFPAKCIIRPTVSTLANRTTYTSGRKHSRPYSYSHEATWANTQLSKLAFTVGFFIIEISSGLIQIHVYSCVTTKTLSTKHKNTKWYHQKAKCQFCYCDSWCHMLLSLHWLSK